MHRIHVRSRLLNITFILLLIALSGCSSNYREADESAPASRTYFIFDTVVTLRVFDDKITSSEFDHIEHLLLKIDQEMNRKKHGSLLDRVNRQAGVSAVPVSQDTFHVIRTALKYAVSSNGKFDPTIGPLVDLWGIGNEGAAVPDSPSLSQVMHLVNYNNVELDEASLTVKLTQAGMSLDLGAIAKGFAADVIAEYLGKQGHKSAIIDLGGNVLAMGSKPGGSHWTIGIQAPEEQRGKHLGTIEIQNKTVVTSGGYERFFEEDGVIYHHILDPMTGYPVKNDLLSVTIVTEESMVADALSTTAFSLGLEAGQQFIEAMDGVEAIFITKDHEIYRTNGLKKEFELTNNDYKLMD